MQTEQEKRAAEVIHGRYPSRGSGPAANIAQALAAAGLLTAPVDGELREALALTLHSVDKRKALEDYGVTFKDWEQLPDTSHEEFREYADAILPMIVAHVSEEKRKAAARWWITTDALARGGAKVLGPFESQGLALDVRSYVERVKGTDQLWVDEEVTDA